MEASLNNMLVGNKYLRDKSIEWFSWYFIAYFIIIILKKWVNLPKPEKELTNQMNRKHWFSWLVGFYDISTLVGYLMPNPLSTYIEYMICKWIVCQ